MIPIGGVHSDSSRLRVARMGFGSLQIDTGALLVMGEHVEVQMRLVEGQLGSKVVSGPVAGPMLNRA